MFAKETYIQRREQLKNTLRSGLLLFLGNDESGMNYEDNTYDFRQDSTFLYYFGLPYAGLSAVIDIDDDQTIIFGDEISIDHIVWMGTQPTLKEKSERVGVKQVMPSAQLPKYLQAALTKGQPVLFLPTYRAEHKLKLQEWLSLPIPQQTASVDFIKAVVNMRNYKTDEEVTEIEKACNVTAQMHKIAYENLRIGDMEHRIASLVTATALGAGMRLSFPVIATVNGQILHNHYHGNTVKEDDMLLLDAGAETDMGYAGDMSSTIPSGAKFTSRQKDVYDVQVASHLAAVEALRPGVHFKEVYELSAKIICEGMKSLGLMKGDCAEAVQEGAHAMFFPCGLGHMMGLDVHDMENLGEIWVGYDGQPKSTQFGRKSLRLARKLEPGFVLTIEPGVYFIPELIDLWKSENKFSDFLNYDRLEQYRHFGGIRNEEDYLITATGARRLGDKIPLTAEEAEEARAFLIKN